MALQLPAIGHGTAFNHLLICFTAYVVESEKGKSLLKIITGRNANTMILQTKASFNVNNF